MKNAVMTDDPNRKVLRNFQCKEQLWSSFEELSHELQCSVDFLINEAMRQYLRTRGKIPSASSMAPMSGPPERPSSGMLQAQRPTPSAALSVATPHQPLNRARPPAPPVPVDPVAELSPSPSVSQRISPVQPPPPSAPMRAPAAPSPVAAGRILIASCEDQTVPVTKPEFFIGRGRNLCDLVIRDTNVSRQHAKVILHEGHHWMVDNQSTNGVEHQGARVAQKRIEDGDTFVVCGHTIRFNYR